MAVTVTYNSQTLPPLVGPFSINESYEAVGFSCTFVVEATDDPQTSANLVSTCSQIEEKLREPFENLVINFNGNTAYNLSHDDNSCLNSKVSWSKGGSDLDTEVARSYQFNFSAGLPADKSGFNHRRRGDFTISKTANGLKSVTFNLEYTASNSPEKTSEVNFNEQAETYATSVLSSIFPGVIFDRETISSSTDHEQKITSGRITFNQLPEAESLAAHNDSNLKGVQSNYLIDRGQRIGVSSSGLVAIPMTRITIGYSAALVEENFSNRNEIHEYYLNNIKPHLIQRAIVNLNLEGIPNTSQGVIVESDTLSIDAVSVSLSGSLSLLAPSSTTDIIDLRETIKESFESGLLLRKLWDGTPFSHSGYHTGSSATITRITVVSKLGSPPSFPPILPNIDLVLVGRDRSGVQESLAENTEVGEQGISIFSEVFVEVYQKANIVEDVPIPIPNPNPETFVPE